MAEVSIFFSFPDALPNPTEMERMTESVPAVINFFFLPRYNVLIFSIFIIIYYLVMIYA